MQLAINEQIERFKATILTPGPMALAEPEGCTAPMLRVRLEDSYSGVLDYATGHIKKAGKNGVFLIEQKAVDYRPEVALTNKEAILWLERKFRGALREIEVWNKNSTLRLDDIDTRLVAVFDTQRSGETRYRCSRLTVTAKFYAYNPIPKCPTN